VIKPEKLDRLPPYSTEAEQGVLGCVLLSPSCVDECETKLRAGVEMFYDLRHQTLYRELTRMAAAPGGVAGIDLVTLQQWLKDRGELENAGGLAYIASLPDQVPTAAGIDYYLDIVLEKYFLRKMIQTCTSIVGQVFENEGEPHLVLAQAERMVLECCDARRASVAVPSTVNRVQAAAQSVIDKWEWAHHHPGVHTGIDSGLIDLDEVTWGWQDTELIIIGGRPSQGKSAMLVGFADHAALVLKLPTLIISLESPAEEIVRRMACGRARVSHQTMRRGESKEKHFSPLTLAMEQIQKAPLFIEDTPGLTIGEVQRIARGYVKEKGVKLILVDYLQIVRPDRYLEKKTYEVGQVTYGLKTMAKEHRIPIIAAAQLSREPEKNADRRGQRPDEAHQSRAPRMSDLADSSQIERDADVIGLLWHFRSGDEDRSMLLLSKVRDGETKNVPIHFNRSITRFENMAKISREDVPNYDHEH